jgi:hypothetical protein
MEPRSPYVARLLALYQKLPGTLDRILRDDHRTALALHNRGVPLDVVENAFILATARRTFRSDTDRLEPIRALRYFLPVIQEIVQEPPFPEYFDYLRLRLRNAGIRIP